MPTINSVAVDEAYSANVIAQLRTNSFLAPGITYNPNFANGSAAALKVNFYKFTKGSVASAAPGSNFSGAEQGNAVVPVHLQNDFMKEYDCRGVTAAAMSPSYLANTILNEAEDIREGRELCAIAALKYGATASSDTSAVTKSTILVTTSDDIAVIKANGGKPSVILISTACESALRQAATAGTAFIPTTNQELLINGVIGQLYGCTVITHQALANASNSAVAYRFDDGTAKSVTLVKTDYIIYDARYFGLVDLVNAARVIDSEDFIGSKVQTEVLTGMRLLDADTNSGIAVHHTHA